jgi:hypothetical protein
MPSFKRTASLALLLLLTVGVRAPHATYTQATVTALDAPAPDGSIHVVVSCIGNSGEPTIPFDLTLRGGVTTANDFRAQVWQGCDAANRSRVIFGLLSVGQNVPRPAAPTPPTACETFRADLGQWYRINAAIQAGILTGAETEVVTFKNQVKGEYAASCLGTF